MKRHWVQPRWLLWATVSSMVVLLAGVFARTPQPIAAQEICFAENPQAGCLQAPFSSYWQGNGALAVFGYPIAPAGEEAVADTGTSYLVQWTERNRLESHPENAPPYNVLLGRIGAERLAQLGRTADSDGREAAPLPGCLWFEETGHNVCNQSGSLGFRSYWEGNGLQDPALDSYRQSLALFGLPLTAATMEVNPTDGRMYLTQWFERARFEWHPQNPDEFKVLLGLLGSEVRSQSPATPALPAAPQQNGALPFAPFGGEIVDGLAARAVPAARAAGVAWVRYGGAKWSEVEPTPGARNWAALQQWEQEVELISASGITPMVVLQNHAPGWARQQPDSACGPLNEQGRAAYVRFVADMVSRYSAPPYNVRYWEIGNEPDAPVTSDATPFGCWGDPNAPYFGGAAFGALLNEVYPAVKAANPDAQVILGGLLLDCDPNAPPAGKDCAAGRFFEGILQAGAGNAVDFVAYHAYAYQQPSPVAADLENPSWQHLGGALLGRQRYLRDVMQQYGIEKPLIANEIGLLCYPGVDCAAFNFREVQAYYVMRLFLRAWGNGIAGASWYMLNAPGWREGGLIYDSERQEPGYTTLRFLGTTLGNATPTAVLAQERNGLEGYQFSSPDATYQGYWTNNGAVVEVALPPGTVAVYNHLGQPVATNGSTVTVTEQPVLIEVR